jgi:enoyl-CoA hydratase/carnithine racemase
MRMALRFVLEGETRSGGILTSPATQQLLSAAGVVATVDGPVMRVILDRPERHNAQTPQMWHALAALGDDLDEGVRVVVLSGNGPSFSAGLDRSLLEPPQPGVTTLAGMARMSAAEFDAEVAGFQRAFTWWRERPVVTIAAVHGHAIGAGFQLALATDLMVVADSTSLSMREVQLGLVPDLAGTSPLVAAVGRMRALELCLTGRAISGTEAASIGLALTHVPDDDLPGAVEQLTEGIIAAMPHATTAVLELLRGAAHRDPHSQRAAERAAQYDRITELLALMGG